VIAIAAMARHSIHDAIAYPLAVFRHGCSPIAVACLCLCLGALAAPSVARAQESGRVGLLVSTPSSAGVIWRISDRVAVRQDITGATSSNGPDASRVTTWNVDAALSGLFYLKRLNPVRVYVSPRYAYTHSNVSLHENGSTSFSVGNTVHSVTASVGAEYVVHRHFGVFAEVGVNRNNGSPPAAAAGPGGAAPGAGAIGGPGAGPAPVFLPVKRYSVAARTAFGLILFF
jgi:hypothetical protein